MGLTRFRVPPTQRITDEMVQQAYLAGIDRVSWPVRVGVEGNELTIQRSVSDSATLHIPWPVAGYGLPNVSTGSLMERNDPYWLPLELARGAIVQVRNQVADWQAIGLATPAAIAVKLAEAGSQFSWAATDQANPVLSAGRAAAALQAALAAGDMLVAAYAEQAVAVRRRGEGRLSSRLGADLGTVLLNNRAARQFLLAFNAAEVPLRWREIEATEGCFSWTVSDKQIQWCRAHGLTVVAGPLLSLDPRSLPDWLYLFEDDFDSVMDFVSTMIREAVERYRGQVDCWICAGQINAVDSLALGDQERLRLVARSIELVRSLDPHAQALASFDQPWAEYLRERESAFPPLHFADALVRADLGLTGIMLEMNVGFSPGGTALRHPVEVNRQLDAWAMLGLPLWLSLSAPGGGGEDQLAQRKDAVVADGWDAAAQRTWIAKTVPLALAKLTVQGVLWNQLCDSRPHAFPHGGLFDRHNRPKPALGVLAAIRKACLK